MGLRDASEYLLPAVVGAINAIGDLEPEDEGLVKLAKHYARTIDQASKPEYATRWIGPELHKVLESLGASPLARSRIKGGKAPVDELDNPLSRLRPVGL